MLVRENRQKNEWGFRDLWDNNKISNISFLTIQEEEHKKKIKMLEKITAENSPNLAKHTNLQVLEVGKNPKQNNSIEIHNKALHNYPYQK